MKEDKLIIVTTLQTIDTFNNISKSSTDNSEINLKTNLFCLFYSQNPVIKKIEDIPAELWINYFFLEGLIAHYSFKNIQSFTKDHPNDSYWIAQKIINEYKIIKEDKKIEIFLKNSNEILFNSKNKDINNLLKDENILVIKKQIRLILSKILISLNRFLRKIEPLLGLIHGHDITPLSLQQFDDNKILQLAEKLNNPKCKEIIKIFIHSNIKELKKNDTNIKQDENQSESLTHIFYINDTTQNKNDEYKEWLFNEMNGYKKDKIYKRQLTAYVKAGNLMSKHNELESLVFALNLLEIARLEKRNCIIIISRDELGEKTFVFKNNEQVEIFENSHSQELSLLDGMVTFTEELLSGPQPPKPKFSLKINFTPIKISFAPKKKKIFKKPTTFIKFT